MACSNGSLLSCETMHPGLAFTVCNDNSDTEPHAGDGTASAEPDENGNGHRDEHSQHGHLGNRYTDIPTGCLNKGSQSLAQKGRKDSSSSTDTDVDSKAQRKIKHRKSRADHRQKNPQTTQCTDSQMHSSCQGCQTDLTDSDVEVCQNCFGLRKQETNTSNSMDEYCPFPLCFLKKKHVPQWMLEPEYVNWHPKDKSERVEGEEQYHTPPVNEKIHRNTDSLLSTTSNFTNYRGLLNLCLLLLVLSNARLCMENLLKYGVLINPVDIIGNCVENLENWPNAKILLYQGIHPLVAFTLQLLLAKGRVPEWFGVVVMFVNGLAQLTYPAWIVLCEHPNPVFSAMTLALVTILFLKLISYAHVNYWCRVHKHHGVRRRQSSTGDHAMYDDEPNARAGDSPPPCAPIVKYPDNLNLKDLTYFVLAPTLCYELNFPRSARIRKRFFLKRLAEMVFLIMVIIGLMQQWIVPTIRNSLKPLSDMDIFKCFERLLKLAIPNHFIWLLFFYAFFHSMLNVLAELLKFGDRDFYQDWWNAETVSDFWKNWNIPVHRWANRHIYKPLRKRGYNQINGSVVVFLVSAFFHEYLVSVPLHMFKVWAFTGMLAQVPLAYITGRYFKGTSGNVIMWVSLIVGQPFAILAYVHDYYLTTVAPLAVNNTMHTLHSALHTEL